MRRTHWLCLGFGALALLRPARAQETNLDAERFKPAVTHDGFVTAEGSAVRDREDPWEFGLYLNYARNTLVAVNGSGDVTRKFVAGRLGFDALASVTLAEPFAIGLALPLFAAQTGDYSPSSAGLGDLRIVPKLRILDDRDGFGLSILAELRAPTHSGDFSGGTRSVVFAPRVVADHRFAGGLRLGLNAGVLVREGTRFYNVHAASEFAYAGALGYRFGGDAGKVELGAELAGAIGLVAASAAETPLEAFPYLKYNPTDEWELSAGPGIGLIAGYGVPVVRGFLGVRFTPTSHDADHDGVPDRRDRCRNVAEDRDHVQDRDGCPEEDGDVDGIPDSEDRCPNAKETINGFEDEDGCPDEGPARVIVEKGRIRILENIRFRKNSAEIDQDSHSILNQVALTMKANPSIKRVRVEGHTDETGTRDLNMQLSRERAESVRQYLVKRGVKPERLSAAGYGPDRPLSRGSDADSLAKNRRVEFIVEQ
ncbi:MAG TPA: OmpA family protein [Polyangiaceae bacterium]|nr:OmpA family protein [Polyangiaceae bacterium]